MKVFPSRPLFPQATDQTVCFDEHGSDRPCRGSGQDGEIRFGRPWPHPRFEIHGGVLLDNLTGLSWPRNAGTIEFPLDWKEAGRAVARLNRKETLGFGDWRLPSRRELFSLVSHRWINPALPGDHLFENVFNSYVWTSTRCARLPREVWTVHLGGGRVFQSMIHRPAMVLPVRGQALFPEEGESPRFADDNGAVTDRWTGITWAREAAPGGLVTWKEAFEQIRELNAEGFLGRTGWRLPNVRELDSVLSLSAHSPALEPGHPFRNLPDACWTSTSSTYDTTYAWTVYLEDGRIGVGFKKNPEFGSWFVKAQG